MMPDKPLQTLTVAPRKQAVVTIQVRFKRTGLPVRGAHASLYGGSAENVAWVRSLGTTDARGMIRFKHAADIVEIQINYANHSADGFPLAPGTDAASIFRGFLAPGPHEFVADMIQVRAQVTVEVIDPEGHPIPGARVTVGAEQGVTDRHGRYTTKSLALGTAHDVQAVREGHGPLGSATPAPVRGQVDLTGVLEVADLQLQLKMTNIWGKIRNSNIVVDGVTFSQWYFDVFLKDHLGTHPTLIYRKKPPLKFPRSETTQMRTFAKVFDDLGSWWERELTLEEFVAVFLIMANETGGSFRPVGERGELAYCFYLNRSPNLLAGNLLQERNVLSDPARVEAWNQHSVFPGVGTDGVTEAQLRECDFWKFRGHGFVQTTWRSLHMARLDPVLKAQQLKLCEAMASQELDDVVLNNKAVHYGLLRAELKTREVNWSQTNAQAWKPFALDFSGRSKEGDEYAALYEWRCTQLYTALRDAGKLGKLKLK